LELTPQKNSSFQIRFPSQISKLVGSFSFGFSLLIFSITIFVLDEAFTGFFQSTHLIWMMAKEYRPERPPIAYYSFLFTSIWSVFYLWAALKSSKPVRIFLSIFFGLSIFIEYGYFHTFHRFMTIVDFWTAMLSPWTLWTEAIHMYFDWHAIMLTVFFILGVSINWKKSITNNFPLLILIVFTVASVVIQAKLPFDPSTGGSLIKFIQLIEKITPVGQSDAVREEVPSIHHEPPKNNLVLVIDESLRGDHLSINGYQRQTTPTLFDLDRQGYLINWGIAVSAATCSIYSNSHILTGVIPTVDSHKLISKWPSVFQYAKTMGYSTVYIDAQQNYLWNGLTVGDQKYIDKRIDTDELGDDIDSDTRAASLINTETKNSTGKFIVVNKRGVHILYENSYPQTEAHWLPTPPGRDYQAYPKLVINAYDNAIHYNIEKFLSALIPDGQLLQNTIIVYTSDHGETLQENGEEWSHCNNTNREASVPLFIIGKLNTFPDTKYQASHSNILPTILDLMHFPNQFRLENYESSLLTARANESTSRYFLDGDLKQVEYSPIQKKE
jgi:glucan phosphoethanolaminetransferase (alkaline phosphatase superfamily)